MAHTQIIGLTGNIGSGKSTVSRIFSQHGWPVFDSDAAGKIALSRNDPSFNEIIATFGEKILDHAGEIDRKKLAQIVFNNPEKIEKLNSIVHPRVKNIFDRWMLQQETNFVIRETALLFETGIYQSSYKNIVVAAPLEIRVSRVMQRNHISREQVLEREAQQWNESEKIRLSDFVIHNHGQAVLPQVMHIIQQLEASQVPVVS